MYDAKGRISKPQLLEEHLQLVKKLAYQLKTKLPANIEIDDLIQAGMIGLLDSLERYQQTETAQFETYAVLRIRGAMLDELRSMDWLPRSIRQSMRKVETALSELEQKLSRPPQEAEIAAQMKISIQDYQKLLADSAGHQLLYFEDFQETDDNQHFLEHFFQNDADNPLQILEDDGFRQALTETIAKLPDREQLLMGLYYEQELNLKEIGAIMGVSESRVSQMHSQAIGRIRSKLWENKWTGAA